jgi:spermidine synthase
MKSPGQSMVNFCVFFTSFSILSYEIIFTRIFAWSQWYNLSPLIITMALLGFGASGSVVSVIQKRIKKDFFKYFYLGLLLFPLFLTIGFILSTQLVFNPYEMTFSMGQVASMFLYFFFMGFCFFLGALIICMAFLKYSVSKTYFYNLSGSGAGTLFVVAVSFFWHPIDIMIGIILISMVGAAIVSIYSSVRYLLTAAIVTAVIITGLGVLISFPGFKKVSQYKAISSALNLPNAQIVHEAYSPLAVVQVIQADGLRSIQGLSLISPFQVPVQKGIFFNADSMSPITPFTGNKNDIQYLEQMAPYLPFYVMDEDIRNHVLIIGSGGGESILKAILSGFKQIDALEVNANVISLMKNQFSSYSGHIYTQKNVTVHNREARSFIKQTQKKYDLIELSMIDAYNTAASGVYALNESYLYTIESIKEILQHLNNTGLLSISRWVVTPARDNLKIFNMVITALHQMGIDNPQNHLIAIRSLQTLTLLVSRSPIRDEMINKTKTFAAERLFDLVYYPDISDKDVNQFIKLKTPIYHEAIQKLLSRDSKGFLDAYDFDIRSATDNRPYFYNFFKPTVIKYIKTYGPSQIPVTEWGYLILLIILLPVFAFSCIFIVLPLMITDQKATRMKKTIFVYFSLIAVGYFFIEMPMIQKMILFLGHPSYSLSVTIAGLLVFSGIGALFSERLFPENKRILYSSFLIVFITGVYLLCMDDILSFLISYPIEQKIVFALIIIAPLGFFMGIPFPCALAILKEEDTFSLAWAWGINGFFSVVSILMATIFAIIYGFNIVIIIAILCYACAGMLSYRLTR